MRLQQPALGRRRLRPRVHVAAVRGYDKQLREVGDTLKTELGLEPTEETLMDEALAASGARPRGASSKIHVPLSRDEPAGTAAAAVLRALLEVTEANIPGAVADLDPEFLHDLRVSVRRARAVQREFRHVFEPDALSGFRAEFRWLQQATGDARDLDVYLLEFNDMRTLVPEPIRPDLDALHGVLEKRRAAARRRTVRALRSERTVALMTGWSAFLGRLAADLQGTAAGPKAERPIGELAGDRIEKVYARMVRMGDAIGPDSPAADYHELRKKGKELRYLLELFGAPLFDNDVVRPMIKSLKALQDVLGRHQDREVQAAMLRSLGDAVAAASEGSAALLAMGALVERLEEDQFAAREQFASSFSTFASKRRRKRVKETFA
jgi:CHAD domain-containing protein